MSTTVAVRQLHDRCAIYTSQEAACRLLDLIQWTQAVDLSSSVLLEPCVGDGAILCEGVKRLIQSFRAAGRHLAVRALKPRVHGYELHPGAARQARRNIQRVLLDEGLAWEAARTLADAWVIEDDFLLRKPGRATHIAANPPYVRWSKVPKLLADQYRDHLPPVATGGDLAVAFLYRMRDWCAENGQIVALISDRWMFTQYGDPFVKDLSTGGWSLTVSDERPDRPFVRDVGAYAAIVKLAKGKAVRLASVGSARDNARQLHARLLQQVGALGDHCAVRVGPALGAGKTYLVSVEDAPVVEANLVRPFLTSSELASGRRRTRKHDVILPYEVGGKKIELGDYPLFAAWAAEHEKVLKARSQFQKAKAWWDTIDAVPAIWAKGPKLLIAEMCKRPQAIIDREYAIPAHSIYAVWSDTWPIEPLQRVLNAGLLELTARALAPSLGLGWVRFYKRFIMMTPLPQWGALAQDDKSALAGTKLEFEAAFLRLFGFPPGSPLAQ